MDSPPVSNALQRSGSVALTVEASIRFMLIAFPEKVRNVTLDTSSTEMRCVVVSNRLEI